MPWLERRQRWYAWKSTWKWTAKYELTPIFLLVSWTWWKFLNRTINSDLCSIRKEGNATDISVWVFFLSFNFTILFHDRYALHRISDEEKTFKLARVKRQEHTKKSVPYIVTHDGRTIRYPDPAIKVDDVVKVHLKKQKPKALALKWFLVRWQVDIATGKVLDILKFEIGKLAMITKGRNTGRVGTIMHVETHPGAFDIVTVKVKTPAFLAFIVKLVSEELIFILFSKNEKN